MALRALPPRLARQSTAIAAQPAKQADPFYLTPAWRDLVADLIRTRGRRCEQASCGRTHGERGQPIRLYADHVQELADGGAPLDPANLRLLCGSCHTRKTIAARAARQAQR